MNTEVYKKTIPPPQLTVEFNSVQLDYSLKRELISGGGGAGKGTWLKHETTFFLGN